ncbi:MAG TPA: CzcE family metal-binding protein [Burkholderiaceae bacterium]
MKRNLAFACLGALLLSGSAAVCQAAEPDAKLLGDAVPPAASEHTVVITPGTNYVNVTGGDIVRFKVGDKAFAWDFDTSGSMMAFDLQRIAPPGVLDHKVMVYVARNPDYSGA